MELTTVWIILIAVLWTGYFVLEGFDFGVGMLFPILGKKTGDPAHDADAEKRRRVLLNTIGPVWDGNEVWVLTAGGATFAAFPHWYATLFAGFYLPLLLILIGLIVRGVAFDYRGKVATQQQRDRLDLLIVVGSFLPALLWGVAFANIVNGVPLEVLNRAAEAPYNAAPYVEYTGNLFTLLNPLGLVGGLTTLLLFLTHGAHFVALKTDGPIRAEARAVAAKTGIATAVVAVVFLVATMINRDAGIAAWVCTLVAAGALLAGMYANRLGREGWAFIGTAATTAFAVWALFLALAPDVLPSTVDPKYSLTIVNAASSHTTLVIMTWAAAVFTPVVLAYQAWTYWVFRKRLTVAHIPDPVPMEV